MVFYFMLLFAINVALHNYVRSKNYYIDGNLSVKTGAVTFDRVDFKARGIWIEVNRKILMISR